MYSKDSQIKFKTSMLKSSLCNYSDAYILAKGTVTGTPVPPLATNPNNNDTEVVFKNFAPFTDCISEINITQTYNANDIDVEMSMCNLVEYSDQEVYGNIIEMKQL